jgi:hypothetical protein
MNRTGAAQCGAATKLGTRQPQHIPQIPKKWHFRIALKPTVNPINSKLDHLYLSRRPQLVPKTPLRVYCAGCAGPKLFVAPLTSLLPNLTTPFRFGVKQTVKIFLVDKTITMPYSLIKCLEALGSSSLDVFSFQRPYWHRAIAGR